MEELISRPISGRIFNLTTILKPRWPLEYCRVGFKTPVCLKKTQNSCQIEFLSRNGRETSSMARLDDSNCKLYRSIQTFNILCCDFLSDLLVLYVWHSMVISLLRNKKHFCRHFDNRSYITSSVAPDPRGSKRTYISISSGNVQIAFSVCGILLSNEDLTLSA